MASAVIYARSSKDRSDVSVDSQVRELKEEIERCGDTFVQCYEDRVESAKSSARPAFQAMMQDARSKSRLFSVVYIYDTSRFTRSQVDAKVYKQELKKLGVELRFKMLPSTDNYTSALTESLMESIDQLHSDKSKADGLRGMRENVLQGYRSGGAAPMGYQLTHTIVGQREGRPILKSKLEPDPITAPKIQAYLRGRAAGVARTALQHELSIAVKQSTLAYIDQSALTYAGHTVWNRCNEKIISIEGGRRRCHYVTGKKFRP
jgi:site-specific DNA recombinase